MVEEHSLWGYIEIGDVAGTNLTQNFLALPLEVPLEQILPDEIYPCNREEPPGANKAKKRKWKWTDQTTITACAHKHCTPVASSVFHTAQFQANLFVFHLEQSQPPQTDQVSRSKKHQKRG